MTERERQIMDLLRQDPMLSQGELAKALGITRSSVGVHLTNLSKKGHILGKGYVLRDQEEPYIAGVGAANIDLMGRSRAPIVMEDSNPGSSVCRWGVLPTISARTPPGWGPLSS